MLPDINNLDDLYISEDVDAYEDHADGLMDALFGEVEHILSVESTETRTLVPVKSRKHSASSDRRISPSLLPSDTVSITKLDLPALAIPSISQQDMIWLDPHRNGGVTLGSEIVLSDSKFLKGELQRELHQELQDEPAQKTSRLLDRVVAIAACTSVIFAASIWIARYGLADIIQQRTAVLPPSTSQPDPEAAQFAEEVKQSFIAISNKEKEKAAIATNAPQPNLSTLPLANNPQLASAFQPIYVPVYQPPTPANPVGLMPAPANTASPTNPAPLAPVTTAPVPNNAPVSPPPAPAAVASVPSTTLVGILDIGDRSSAMFEMNGSVQSVLVGDRVAGNGWILNRITQQEAILKRGNETKTLYVGQKF
jgi:hypothetical protein